MYYNTLYSFYNKFNKTIIMDNITEIEQTFAQLMDTIYTVETKNGKLNVINVLSWIMHSYIDIHFNNYADNVCVIIVGGAPADVAHAFLRQQKPIIKDVDMATNLTPNQMIEAIQWYNTLTTNDKIIDFHLLDGLNQNSVPNGTVNIYIDNETIEAHMRQIEITTFRKESGQRGEHLTNAIGLDIPKIDAIHMDRTRRDLTIGTLYTTVTPMQTTQYEGIFFEFLKDHPDSIISMTHLSKGIVSFMGNPLERVWEDGIRLLRFMRKGAKSGFQMDIVHLTQVISLLEGLHVPIPIEGLIGDDGIQLITKPISYPRILGPTDGELFKLLMLPGAVKILSQVFDIMKTKNELRLSKFLYLPENINLERLSSPEWCLRNDRWNRYISTFLTMEGEFVKGSISTLKFLSKVDNSTMGNYRTLIFTTMAMVNHIMENNIDMTNEKQIILLAHNTPNILSKFNEIVEIKKLSNKKINLNSICNFMMKSSDETDFILKYYKKYYDTITSIKKSVYLDKSIQDKDKTNIYQERVEEMLKYN